MLYICFASMKVQSIWGASTTRHVLDAPAMADVLSATMEHIVGVPMLSIVDVTNAAFWGM